jgi:anthranilate phosphoribosyltransferase
MMGVFHPDLVGIQARVLQRLGSRRVIIVHGMEGLDEASISGPTMVGELKDGEVREYFITPQEFGLAVQGHDRIRVADVEQSKSMILAALENREGAARDIVSLNAGISIYVAGLAATLGEGVTRARSVLADGAARRKLDEFVAFTRSVAAK